MEQVREPNFYWHYNRGVD